MPYLAYLGEVAGATVFDKGLAKVLGSKYPQVIGRAVVNSVKKVHRLLALTVERKQTAVIS